MWYAAAGVLILKDSVCPGITLIDVAKPWIVESPAPLTCQSLGGSPAKEFSHAITLVTGGPQAPAAAADRTLTRRDRLSSTASPRTTTERRARARRRTSPVTDMSVPPRA